MNTKGKIMISCEESTFLSSKHQHVKPSFGERIKQFMHLLMCVYCRRFSNQIQQIDKAIHNLNKNAVEANIKLTTQQKQKMEELLQNSSKH